MRTIQRRYKTLIGFWKAVGNCIPMQMVFDGYIRYKTIIVTLFCNRFKYRLQYDKSMSNLKRITMIEIGIEKVELLNENDKREVKVTMKSGSEIHILSCCNSWQQYGGLLEEEQATVPIAEKYNKWLHGID